MRKTIGTLVLGPGCAVAFTGMAALLMAGSGNAQVQLVVSSFQEASRHVLVNAISACMRFAMQNGWQMIAAGFGAIALGTWLLACAKPAESKAVPAYAAPEPERELPPTAAPVETVNPFAVAAAPPVETLPDFAPAVRGRQTVPAFVTYNRPMLDANLVDEPPPRTPDAFRTESKAIATETGSASPSGAKVILRTPQSADMPEAQPVAKAAQPVQPARPRIVSTMGKHTL